MNRKILTFGCVLVLALALTGCGGTGSDPSQPAQAPVTPESNPAAAPAVASEPRMPSAARWVLSEGQWANYSSDDGLPSDRIHALSIDEKGSLWVGTDRGGGWFNDAQWTDVVPRNMVVMDFAFDDQGRAWIADGRGVDVYEAGNLTTYGYDEGLTSVQTRAMLVDLDGRIWVGLDVAGHGCLGGENAGGINVFENGEWRWIDTGELFGSTALELMMEQDGTIWVVGLTGLARFDSESGTAIDLPLEEGAELRCGAIDPEGRIWIGAKKFGLWVWDGEAWEQYSTEDGLAGDTVWTIAFDEAGRAWVGTGDGLSVYDGEEWTTYTTEDGLTSNEIRALAIAEDGVWVGTFRGLNHLVMGEAD
jgi:ligand-binding sensor domain-containing protein